jgi:type IV pilus assembly protein PilA
LNNAQAALPKPEQLIGNFVTRIDVEKGALHVRLGNRINAKLNGKNPDVSAGSGRGKR